MIVVRRCIFLGVYVKMLYKLRETEPGLLLCVVLGTGSWLRPKHFRGRCFCLNALGILPATLGALGQYPSDGALCKTYSLSFCR